MLPHQHQSSPAAAFPGRVTGEETPAHLFDHAPAAGTLVVGTYLRELRRAANRTQQEAARVIDTHLTKISRIETGGSPQREADAAALLRFYAVLDWHRTEAVRRLVQASKIMRSISRDAAAGWTERLASCERAADAVRVYTSWLIPGMLRIPAYEAALVMPGHPGATQSAHASRRLADGHGKDVTVLLDEAVLLRPVGGPAVMAAQLAHLERVVARGDARILVVPLTSSAVVPTGLLSELTLHQHQHKLLVEESVGAVYSTGPDQGRTRSRLLDAALAGAAPADQSAAQLKQARIRFENAARRPAA